MEINLKSCHLHLVGNFYHLPNTTQNVERGLLLREGCFEEKDPVFTTNKALVSRIEPQKPRIPVSSQSFDVNDLDFFRIESIADDDMLVRYYTGFTTYPVVLDPC